MAMHDGEIACVLARSARSHSARYVSHSARIEASALKKSPFEVRINHAFAETMAGCAERASTWIDQAIVNSYTRLYEMGYAHSVETWQEGHLVGGLYGVAMGGAFFGESMFSKVTDASKVALVHLVERMRERGFLLLDTQWSTPHSKQFGCEDISRSRYMRLLERALTLRPRFVD